MTEDPRRSTARLLALLIACGLLLTLLNRGLPLVRNSLVYARASENIVAHGYDPRPVVADSALSYNKPILYPWLSAPFVRAFGNHDGLRITSFATTAALLAALVYFARSFRSRLPETNETLLLWLCALGPCVFYQFWSAHPDGWFAALAVLAWGLCERIVAEPSVKPVRRVLALGATLYLAILLKNYGLVLLISCPLYFLWHLRALRQEPAAFRRLLVASLAVFGAIGALALLAWKGHNSLSRLEGEGGGFAQYAKGELAVSARGTWIQLALSLGLQFQLAWIFALRRAAWTKKLIAPLVCFAGPYVVGLMPFPTTFYNMRYFVPLFALAGLILVRGAADMRPGLRRGVLVAHGLVAVTLILVFNVAPIWRRVEPAVPKLEVNWIGVPLSLLDNLRMRLHLEQARELEQIDREVPRGATLYMLDVGYYVDAQHGVFERAGLIRPDIATRYVSSRGFEPAGETFYVYAQRPARLEKLGTVAQLADHLYRVERAR